MRRRRVTIGRDEESTLESPRPDAYSGASAAVLKFALGAVLGFLLLGYAASGVALHRLLDRRDMSEWVGPRAGALLNRHVDVGDVSVSFFPRPRVDVADVRIGNLAGFEGPPLAQVERVRFGVSLLPLLRGKVRLRQLRLERPLIQLAVDADGTSNFGDLLPHGPARGSGEGPPISIGIDDIEVTDAHLTLRDAPHDRWVSFDGVGGTADVFQARDSTWVVRATARADSLAVRSALLGSDPIHLVGPTLEASALADPSLEGLTLDQGTIHIGDAALRLIGRVDSLDQPTRSVDIRLAADSLPLEQVLSVLPAAARASLPAQALGRVAVDLRLRGLAGPDRSPRPEGVVHVEDLALRDGANALLEHVTGRIAVRGDSLVADSLEGSFLGGDFVVDGFASTATRTFALWVSARPDLDVLDRLGMAPARASVSGSVRLAVAVGGSLDAPGDLRIDGRAEVAGMQLEHERLGVPLYVPHGEVTFAGTDAEWDRVATLVGEDRLVTSGRLHRPAALFVSEPGELPELEATVAGAALDLGAALPAGVDEPGEAYAHLAFARIGRRRLAGRSAQQIASQRGLATPDPLPLRGTIALDLDTLDYRAYHLERARAQLVLGDDLLGARDVSAEIWAGTLRGAVMVTLEEDDHHPFSLELQAENVGARDFLAAMTPVGDAVEGTLTLSLDVSGAVGPDLLPWPSTLAGTGRIDVRDGRLATNPVTGTVADFLSMAAWTSPRFSTWSTPFTVDGDRLVLGEAEMHSELGGFSASGAIYLGGALDLACGLSIPPDRLEEVSLRRTGVSSSVLGPLRRTSNPLELGFRMGGLIDAPTLEPDARLASSRIRVGEQRAAAANQVRRAPR